MPRRCSGSRAIVQRPGAILHAKHDAGAVVAGWLRGSLWFGENDKTRRVDRQVLNIFGNDGNIKMRRGTGIADGGAVLQSLAARSAPKVVLATSISSACGKLFASHCRH